MEVISTLGIVLSSLVNFADTERAEHDQQNVEICTLNLTAIGKAVQAYHNENGDFPEWLSELYPKYLSDANLLLCPVDEERGKPAYPINEDPKMPVSYDYQFHPKYREEKTEERLIYGDVIPLARCRHHENQPFECLNLSFSFEVYPSTGIYTSEEMYGSPEKAVVAFGIGSTQAHIHEPIAISTETVRFPNL